MTYTTAPVTDGLRGPCRFSTRQYSLRYAAGSHGRAEGASQQQVPHGQDGTTVLARPDSGHHFAGWSDDRRSIRASSRTYKAMST